MSEKRTWPSDRRWTVLNSSSVWSLPQKSKLLVETRPLHYVLLQSPKRFLSNFSRIDRRRSDGYCHGLDCGCALNELWNHRARGVSGSATTFIHEVLYLTVWYVTLRHVYRPQKLVIVKKTSTMSNAATGPSPAGNSIQQNKNALSTNILLFSQA